MHISQAGDLFDTKRHTDTFERTPSTNPCHGPFASHILHSQGVMCICYAQMMSAVMMFMLICLLVSAFIDEEQFLKTHYYTASKRLFTASMM